MKRIVVGTDLAARSRGAVERAADLSEALDATLHLVTACAVPPVTGSVDAAFVPSTGDIVAPIRTELAALAQELRRRDIAVEEHVTMGSASEGLCSVAKAVEADIIVVGNKRMKGKGRLLGSVPSKVAHHADCDVLIVSTD